jgi:NAD(P)H-flavin reductase
VSTTRPPGQHVAVKHAQTRHATEARAYDPASAPADEVDFGIGSQR